MMATRDEKHSWTGDEIRELMLNHIRANGGEEPPIVRRVAKKWRKFAEAFDPSYNRYSHTYERTPGSTIEGRCKP